MKKRLKIWDSLFRGVSIPRHYCSGKKNGEAGVRISKEPQFFVGNFTTGEAKRLLEQFIAQGIRFEIECDVGAPPEAINGGYGDLPRIAVFVDATNIEKTVKIVDDLRVGE